LRATLFVAGGAVLAYLLIAWGALPETRPTQREGEAPARFREAARDRVLVLLVLASGLTAVIYGLLETAVPVFLHDDRGLALASWGLIFGLNPLLVAVFQYPIARRAARQSTRAVLAASGIVMGAALALLWPFEGAVVVAVAIVLFTLGEMLGFPVAFAAAADLAPARLRGSYQGALNLAFEGAWAPAALGGLWLVGIGHGELMARSRSIGLVAAGAFLLLPGRRLGHAPPVVSPEPVRP
jgi:predicted MFS family arabinose efflux permease